MNHELVVALTDVRRAYRLLWAFQKRVLEYVQLIHERLGFENWEARSLLPSPPAQHTANLRNGAIWGLLPMADMEFGASRRRQDFDYRQGQCWDYPRRGDAVLYSRIRADTGIPEDCQNDPSPLGFNPVEGCYTKLSLFVLLNRQDRDEQMQFWRAAQQCRKMTPGQGTLYAHPNIPGIDIFGAEFDLADLPDELGLLKAVNGFKTTAGNTLRGLWHDNPPDP
jgi:hypothetical protein